METVILIRYGEIFLKGKNRGFFEKTLLTNIRNSLEKFNLEVNKVPGRFLVEKYDEDDEFEIIERIKKIAGIFSFSPSIYFDTSLDEITKNAVEMMAGKKGTFKVETNRADKKFELN